ncbi:MAG: glycosyltransferase family 4 protein [Vicinamibacterales bacterium]
MSPRTVWIINPYGTLPLESWATYRSTMLADSLVQHGYEVRQFISNFEHRGKTFRTATDDLTAVSEGYHIHIIPSTAYESHVSFRRIAYERTFARNLLQAARGLPPPGFIVLAEPALFYYDILLEPLLRRRGTLLILDIIDIWPELFELVLPRFLGALSRILLGPLYWWRARLYKHADAIVAVARDYLDSARRMAVRPDALFEVVYWSYDIDREDSSPPTGVVRDLVDRKARDEVWAVYAGTLGENYDIASLLDVARRLPRDLQDTVRVRFIIAGDGPMKDLCRHSASDSLVFAGRLRAPEMKLLYSHADIGLCTYKGQSTVAMPIKAFDCLRYGLPIVNSLGRDLGELVRVHELGINYDPYTADGLYRAVERLASDAALRDRCATNARKIAPEFSSRAQYPKFAALLNRLSQVRAPADASD